MYGQEIFVNRIHYISIDLTTNLDFWRITNVAAMTPKQKGLNFGNHRSWLSNYLFGVSIQTIFIVIEI